MVDRGRQIPSASFAIISGSAVWGIAFPEDVGMHGVRVLDRDMFFDTPWGHCGPWRLIELDADLTEDRRPRRVLNVRSHGWPDDAIDHSVHRSVAWVLAEAGVKKVLADSTCGSLNKALQPRDFVIAHDVVDLSQTLFSGLAGRMRQLCLANQLFCPALARTTEAVARDVWPSSSRVFGQASRLVVFHNWGPRFTSAAEAQAFRLLGGDIVNQSIAPEATAMREIGACFVSASYVVSYEIGVVSDGWEDLDSAHQGLALSAGSVSLLSIARADLTDDCGCAALRVQRPETYQGT